MDLDAELARCGEIPLPESESNPEFRRWLRCTDQVRARWCVAYPKACACKPDWFRESVRPGNPRRCAEQNAWVSKKLDGW